MDKENDEKISIAKAMRRYGGSFVSSLGEALIHADPINTMKIQKAFPDYWKQYKAMGKIFDKNLK